MTTNGWIYQLDPTDWFLYVVTLEDARELSAREDESCPGWSDELEHAYITAAWKIRHHTSWEGDGTWYVGALPQRDSGGEMLPYLMVKQRNNGTTYVWSPVEMPHLGEQEASPDTPDYLTVP